jgi:hypothetical protein
MYSRALTLICMGGALALGACGSASDDPGRGEGRPKANVPLAAESGRPGEIVVKGEGSPDEHGPFDLEGRYRVRFEQTAPEDPSIDFAGETPFVVRLVKPDGRGRGRRLFRAAEATGDRVIAIHGRFRVMVEFGDWPYAIRFTPVH